MEHNGFEYVDMGTSVLWATSNVGADDAKDIGLYFQWGGDVVGYTANDMKNKIAPFGIQKIFSNHTNLPLDKDIAHVYMGNGWRMSTEDEFLELFRICDVSWLSKSIDCKCNCALLESKYTKNKLIIPTSGLMFKNKYTYRDYIVLWCGTPSYGYTDSARCVYSWFGKNMSTDGFSCTCGINVRGVVPKD